MGIKVNIRAELTDATMIPLTRVEMPGEHKTFEEYGIHWECDPGFATPVHAVAQYLTEYWGAKYKDMKTLIGIQNKNLCRLGGVYADGSGKQHDCFFWMYMINDKYPAPPESKFGYNMMEYQLKNEDSITIYAVEYPYTNYYGFFQENHFNVKLGEIVNLTLLARRVTGGPSFPVSGASLIPSDIFQAYNIHPDIITDSKGRASICFHNSGSYIISALRKDLSRSYTHIKVLP